MLALGEDKIIAGPPKNRAGPGAPADAKTVPHLRLVFAGHLYGIVCAGRAKVISPGSSLIFVHTRINHNALTRNRQLISERIGVRMRRQIIGTSLAGIQNQIVAGLVVTDYVVPTGR